MSASPMLTAAECCFAALVPTAPGCNDVRIVVAKRRKIISSNVMGAGESSKTDAAIDDISAFGAMSLFLVFCFNHGELSLQASESRPRSGKPTKKKKKKRASDVNGSKHRQLRKKIFGSTYSD